MFYSTAADIEDRTTLTQRQQDRAVTHLEELNLISTKLKGMPAKKYYKINLDTEILLPLLRNKTKDKPSKTKKDSGGGNSGNIPEPERPKTETPHKTEEIKGESSIDKMSKQASAEPQTLVQQNVETSIDKMLNQDSTKSESMVQQNVETFLNINNNKNINKKNNNEKIESTNNKQNNAHARDENENPDNFVELINNFTADEKVRTALSEYINMRLKRPRTVTTEYSLKLVLDKLAELSVNPEMQIKILNQSIINSYPDLYELRKGAENGGYHGKFTDTAGFGTPYLTGFSGRKADEIPIKSGNPFEDYLKKYQNTVEVHFNE
jgi:hypothetical protein